MARGKMREAEKAEQIRGLLRRKAALVKQADETQSTRDFRKAVIIGTNILQKINKLDRDGSIRKELLKRYDCPSCGTKRGAGRDFYQAGERGACDVCGYSFPLPEAKPSDQ